MLEENETAVNRSGAPNSHAVMALVVVTTAAMIVPAILVFAFVSWIQRNLSALLRHFAAGGDVTATRI